MNVAELAVEPISLAGQQSHYGRPFPLALACGSPAAEIEDAAGWVAASRAALGDQLAAHGAILFRGFPLRSDRDFDAFAAAFGFRNFPYAESLSNAVRVNRTERVFTANEAPPEVTIQLHHEMAQTPLQPDRLFFYCQQPADSGGATPLCRSDVLLERLAERLPAFVAECEAKGLRYSHVMPAESDLSSGMGRSWQSTLGAGDRAAAEQRLSQLGYTWQWLDDGALRVVTGVLPAVRRLPSGRKSFFNQLIAAFLGWRDARNDPATAITFGDGSRLDRQSVLTAAELAAELSFDLAWQAGDVALLDNDCVMHGRRTFQGTRVVLASLAMAGN